MHMTDFDACPIIRVIYFLYITQWVVSAPTPICPQYHCNAQPRRSLNFIHLVQVPGVRSTMNTTTATNQTLYDPTLEVLGVRLTSYLNAMGIVILQYDCLLTLKDEV